MRLSIQKTVILLFITIMGITGNINAQPMTTENTLSTKEQSIVSIAALTAKGDLDKLKIALNTGLENGLPVNETKEALVHLYAYCGFPRSIRGLQTFMQVLDDRKAKDINGTVGNDASPIDETSTKYERGKKVLEELTKTPQPETLTGYSAFAPTIDRFLKEHLFADIFERDVLTYKQRELVTISVIAAIGHAEPMLKSHLTICLNVGLTAEQLQQFVAVIKTSVGKNEAISAQKVLNEIFEKP